MRLHPNIIAGIIECLKTIFQENKYTDDVLDKTFRNHKQWGSRDRRFIAESVYECVRWQRFYAECGNAADSDELLTEKILAVHFIKNEIDLPDWYAKTNLDKTDVLSVLGKNAFSRKIKESIPDWLDELGEQELGKKWAKQLHALNEQAQVVLRVNTLKTNVSELTNSLLQHQIEVVPVPKYENALSLVKRQNLAQLEEYKQGLFEIQDAGSQAIAPFLQVEPGMNVIDACAGGGGKTLHLAALMQNQGEITALDIENKKLFNLKERANRAGVNIITTYLASDETLLKLHETADRLLLDVPCSGLGVLKRNPDAKWKLSLDEIEKVKLTQQTILSSYPSMLKKGGIMVYATCSILPSENHGQVSHFLEQQGGQFELLEEKQVWPSEGFDGFYMARIRKK